MTSDFTFKNLDTKFPAAAGFAPTRRDFLKGSLAAGAGLAIATPLALASRLSDPKSGKLKILVLGGTGFLGPAFVEIAKERGHDLTLFNRGRREKTKGTSFEGVEKLNGNRDPNKRSDEKDEKSPMGLSQLEALVKEGRRWDAVIDTSGYYPRHVRASAELLSKAATTYLFISTISVYASNANKNEDESAPVGTLSDPTVETMGAQSEYYGPLKALCEQEAEKAFPGRALNIRPGFIVGKRDDTDRFSYWPIRMGQGGTMLIPGSPTDPIQWIDVYDLASFMVLGVEKQLAGVYNATGPTKPATWGELIEACDQAAKRSGRTPAKQEWIPIDFLQSHGVEFGSDLPIYIPPMGEYAGFHTRSVAKAAAAGMTCRPAVDTCADLLAWWPTEVERRVRVTEELKKAGQQVAPGDPSKLRVGLAPEKEATALKAWADSKAAPK